MRPAVYVHIPFCEQRCYYCAFTVSVSPEAAYEPYIRRVIREIELSGWNNSPETIFFGGGTPSIVPANCIEHILRSLPPGAEEISLEANPGTLDGEKLRIYRDCGVNRVSLGVQSFHDEELKAAGRLHSSNDVFADFDSLRRYGFTNLNLDLIAGLPNQRLELWRANLDWIERIRPEHVSIYMLELEERSPWSKKTSEKTSRKTPDIPADEQFVRFYETACERLEKNGYVHYEISNWALPGFACRHNQKYWTGAAYRAFGVGAHSFEDGRRSWNTSSLTGYAERIDAGELPVEGSETLSLEMRIEEGIMLGLRQMCGFNVHVLADQLGIRYPSEWFARVETLRQGGLVAFDGTVLKLTPAGWLLATSVTEELIWPALLSISEATP